MRSDLVSIVVPTYKRPAQLVTALRSALEQRANGFELEVVVIDNDPEASACEAAWACPGIRYVAEARTGLSHARNRGLVEARGRYIFFLDDDMEALPGCIAALLDGLAAHDAQIAFAAVDAVLPSGVEPGMSRIMRPLFSRRPDWPEGPIAVELGEGGLGAGGAMIDRGACVLPDPAFDSAQDASGGEDDVFFETLRRAGAQFSWVPSARTLEHVPAHRATLAYLWKRNFAFGQGPAQTEADRDRALGVAKWMLVGLAQMGLRLPVWAVRHALRSPQRARSHALLAQALGKIVWWQPPTLYGPNAQPPCA